MKNDDTIFGETDRDKLYGDEGGDYLEGGAGNDFARGGDGDDLLIAGYGSDDLDGQQGEDTYRITARGGLVTELTIMYDTGENIGPNGEARPPDHVVLIGTSQADTVLLRAMADYYFPLVEKLVGGVVKGKTVDGLTDRIFASQEPDKLRSVLQALEDAYGPHAVENVVNIDGEAVPLAELYKQIVKAYTDAVRVAVLAAIDAEVKPIPGNAGLPDQIKDRVTAILDDTTTGLFPGKLEEIVQAIKLAYGDATLPGNLINKVNQAWETFADPADPLDPDHQLKKDIEDLITAAYRSEFDVLGTNTDTGFVALLNNGGSDVERFNYRDIEDITVNTLDGNDYVVLDDVLAATTVNLGLGEDKVQVGQVFRSERVRQFDNEPLITGIKAEDVFTTLEITRGWLSNGVSQATTINGEDGNDQFTVFHNIAVLNLNGGDGDDFFTVRAFALKGSSDSERARTDMKGDGGADTILYVLNAPVGIDGGDGFDTVRIIGTEFADDFVVTDGGVFGGGLNVSYVNIEKLIADGAEGNDRFFVHVDGYGGRNRNRRRAWQRYVLRRRQSVRRAGVGRQQRLQGPQRRHPAQHRGGQRRGLGRAPDRGSLGQHRRQRRGDGDRHRECRLLARTRGCVGRRGRLPRQLHHPSDEGADHHRADLDPAGGSSPTDDARDFKGLQFLEALAGPLTKRRRDGVRSEDRHVHHAGADVHPPAPTLEHTAKCQLPGGPRHRE